MASSVGAMALWWWKGVMGLFLKELGVAGCWAGEVLVIFGASVSLEGYT